MIRIPMDFATDLRRSLIDNTSIDITDFKIQRAKEQLGKKYLCHPNNQVKRLAEPYKGPAHA